ncbi:MAG TPA: 4Fe-4S double cluster binding domain-containing protein [Thermoleophilia bacterium]|nr:4Fe-4S double cluster binding domain-containing protein [Thermoleophilia bacterium]
MSEQSLLTLEKEIYGLAMSSGACDLGVADLAQGKGRALVEEQGGTRLSRFPRAISFAMRLQDGLVDDLPEGHREAVTARLYDAHIYKTVNSSLDQIGLEISCLLQDEGHTAVSIPASLYVDGDDFLGPLPHKLAARLAGIGWIGKSALLVTRNFGPRVRLGTVLTDAPLPAGEPPQEKCGSCENCVEACPPGALLGRSFSEDEPVGSRMDVRACRDYRHGLKETTGVQTCGVCVSVCPQGSRRRTRLL